MPVARAIQLTTMAAPGLVAIAYLLFTGGRMSRLPAAPVLQGVAACALVGAFALIVALAASISQRASTQRTRRLFALSALGAGFLLGKADQLVMPGLYAYLHAALGASAFLCHTAALAKVLRERERATRGSLVAAIVVIAVGTFASTLYALDDNQNVRVALMHPMRRARAR